ncbi:MAG: amidohydrolase family protein [bacterium]
MRKILTDCSLLTGPGEEFIKSGYLAIEEGEIKSLGKKSLLPEEYSEWPRESLEGNLVIPGLINTHTHIPMALLRGWAEDLSLENWLDRTRRFREEFYDNQVVRLSVRLALVELIKSGVTTFADMSVGQDLYLDIIQKSGLRAVLFETIMEYVFPDNCEKLHNFLKNENKSDLISRGAALHAPYSSDSEIFNWFRQEIKKQYNPLTSIHLAETAQEIEICRDRFNYRPVGVLNQHGLLDEHLLAVHGVFLNKKELDLLAERGVKLSHNPECNMKIGAGVAPVDRALQAGLTVALGTDSQASNNDQDMFGEMRSAAYLQKVACRDPRILKGKQVFKMVSTGAARALEMENTVGRLARGKRADLTVIDFNQVRLRPVYDPISLLIYSVNCSDVLHTMVDGRWLMKDREVLTLEEGKVIAEVEKQREKYNTDSF